MDALFGSPSRVRLLRTLALDPARVWTEREAAKRLAMSPNTVNLAVRVLRDAGLLEFRRLGRSNTLRLRNDLGITRLLLRLFALEREAVAGVQDAIRLACDDGVACLMYGSTARGTAKAGSDVDLLVVARSRDQAEQAAADIRAAVARVMPVDLSIAALPKQELDRQRAKQPWIANALQDGVLMSRVAPQDVV